MNKPNGPTFLSVYSDSVRAFNQALPSSTKLDRKSVHQLRVTIKNLRALLVALSTMNKRAKRGERLREIIDPLFKRAGKLRGAQTEKKLLLQSPNGNSNYEAHLRKRIKRQRNKLKDALENFDTKKFQRLSTNTRSLVRSVSRKQFTQVLDDTIARHVKEVSDFGSKKRTADLLHDIRKHLRVVRSLGQTRLRLHEDPGLSKQLTRAREVETRIGDWRDNLILAQSLNEFAEKNDDQRKLAKTLKARNDRERIEVERLVDALLVNRDWLQPID